MKTCPMCGYGEVKGPTFVESPRKDGNGNVQALRYTCKRCAYIMHTETMEVTLARQMLAQRQAQEKAEDAAREKAKKGATKSKDKK